MFEESRIVAGIEIGTSKICVVVGQASPDGQVNIIGLGQAISRGVRKGEIVNPQEAEEDLRMALSQAELMADCEIRSAYVGVTGGHIRTLSHRGFHRVVAADYEITDEDVEDVVSNAQAINLPVDGTLLHTIRQGFKVGGEDGVINPVGMHGAQLEVELHVVHAKVTRLQNTVRLVKATSLEVEKVVFNALAAGLAVLTPGQKQLGALVIDLGGGTTEYVVYSEGIIRHSGVLTIGGDHVTNDLAFGLKLSLMQAEKLKKDHGTVVPVNDGDPENHIGIHDEYGREIKRVKVAHVQRIMTARFDELFRIIAAELEQTGQAKYLRAGIVLTGGGSRVPGLASMAESIFQMEARPARECPGPGQSQALDQPEFMTAIGLAKYGAMDLVKSPAPRASSWWSRFCFGMRRLREQLGW